MASPPWYAQMKRTSSGAFARRRVRRGLPRGAERGPDKTDLESDNDAYKFWKCVLERTGIPPWLDADLVIQGLASTSINCQPSNGKPYQVLHKSFQSVMAKAKRKGWGNDMELPEGVTLERCWAVLIYGDANHGYEYVPKDLQAQVVSVGLQWLWINPATRIVPKHWRASAKELTGVKANAVITGPAAKALSDPFYNTNIPRNEDDPEELVDHGFLDELTEAYQPYVAKLKTSAFLEKQNHAIVKFPIVQETLLTGDISEIDAHAAAEIFETLKVSVPDDEASQKTTKSDKLRSKQAMLDNMGIIDDGLVRVDLDREAKRVLRKPQEHKGMVDLIKQVEAASIERTKQAMFASVLMSNFAAGPREAAAAATAAMVHEPILKLADMAGSAAALAGAGLTEMVRKNAEYEQRFKEQDAQIKSLSHEIDTLRMERESRIESFC